MTEDAARQRVQKLGFVLWRQNDRWGVSLPGPDARLEESRRLVDTLPDTITAAEELKTIYGTGHDCKVCGEYEANRYMDTCAERLKKDQHCFNCDFWLEKVRWREQPTHPAHLQAAVVNGTHYLVHPKVTNPGWGCGFGGQLFTVRWHDGRTAESNNVWCQGRIPDRWRERLPDNAVFE
jgi:hypothetical protein